LNTWLPMNGPALLETPIAASKEVYVLHPATRLMHMLHQVALGMSALGRMGIIHRDLAARNVLVSDNLGVKVADFGLSRDVEVDRDYYVMTSDSPIPLKWTSPEAIKDKKYSAASDVYSFGVLCFEVFSFGKDPFTAYRAQMKFVYFSAHGKEPIHQPLMAQLTDALDHHGVAGVPAAVEELLRGCVAREMAERLTFAQVIAVTGRASREGVPIKHRTGGGADVAGGRAAGGGAVGGAGAGSSAVKVDAAGGADADSSAGYSSCNAESQPTSEAGITSSGYSACVGEYATGEDLQNQPKTGGHPQGLVAVGAAASRGCSQGLGDVGAAATSGYSQGLGAVGAAASSGYSQGLVDVGAAGSSGALPVISRMQNNDSEGVDGGYLGVQASVIETAFDGGDVGGAGAVYHLSSDSKGSNSRPADAVYHLANRETKTSWMDDLLEVTSATQGGGVQASTVADGAGANSADEADGAKSADGSPDVTAPRSITRREQPSRYHEVEGEDDDEGTRL
jgi:hypothetical protein